ncbi:MAG: hypothetical protein MUF22_05730, partial [Chitinispirillaceae bacterium]|nr:hypothetical protein [Chitinispirillaceae bacterium]
PSIEKSFNRHFQENLAGIPDVNIIDDAEVSRLRSIMDRFSYPTMTAPLYRALQRFAADTAFVIWGRIKQCEVKPVRRYVIFGAVEGTLTVEFSIYNMASKTKAYAGTTQGGAFVKKGFVFFKSVDQAVQVSSLDRAQLLEKLQLSAAENTGMIVESVFGHETAKRNKVSPVLPGLEEEKVPIDYSQEAPASDQPEVTDTEAAGDSLDSLPSEPAGDSSAEPEAVPEEGLEAAPDVVPEEPAAP